MNVLDTLPRPFFVLAPMDDVTDTVFRQVIAATAAPDLFFTEFVNVDALQSKGRVATLPRLQFTESERPLIAQLWGLHPDNFYKSARDCVEMGFDAIDLNFGCPDKNVVRNGACSAFILPENRSAAVEIIQAVKDGAGELPVTLKTRLGFNEIDFTWHELLLQQNVAMLTIHGRTRKQMSNVPAQWDQIEEIRKLRDAIAPHTLMVGNGDVLTRQQGIELAKKHGLDGVMVGRGIFQDPYLFAQNSKWSEATKEERIGLYRRHVALFRDTWQNNERKIHTLNKFCKVYIQSFDGAKELRERLMQARSAEELMTLMEENSNSRN